MDRSTLKPIADLIFEQYPGAVSWTEEHLLDWLQLAASEGRLICALDDEKNYQGALIVRTFFKLPPNEDITTPSDPAGDIIHLDLAVAKDKDAAKVLALGAVKLLGLRPLVAFRHDGKIRIHNTRKALNALFKQRN